ncbi:glycosyltransferase family 8 protein [Sphingobacterium kyonggiense]|uniref:Glycosyltransferase family 8 protein n=1 Tax=Sphingobacterium kyonggiense TaxID=714075 RepID=A0ABP7YVL2_9SPHI
MSTIIPIVFCFDDNLLMPAGICLNSLLLHANKDTFYDIFILHDYRSSFPSSNHLERLHEVYSNFKIHYRNIGNSFDNAFEIRGITKAAYYRLLIPEVIKEYEKVFYFDVDIIFRSDLSKIYHETNLDNFYVAGVATPYTDLETYVQKNIKMNPSGYICSGTILMNSKKMLEDQLVPQFKKEAEKEWKYQDQDVLNLVCKERIKLLPPWFGVVGTVNEIVSNHDQEYYDTNTVNDILNFGTIHYNGAKPWKSWCYNFDIWWEYYRKSIYFDQTFYFEFYHNKLVELDNLPLIKRIKILLRYFFVR